MELYSKRYLENCTLQKHSFKALKMCKAKCKNTSLGKLAHGCVQKKNIPAQGYFTLLSIDYCHFNDLLEMYHLYRQSIL